MQKTIALGGLLLIHVFAGGCASSPRAQDVPEVSVSMLRILPEENGRRPFSVTLLLRNPNIEPVELRSIDFSIRLGPAGFIEGTIDEPTVVPALGDAQVRATVSSEFVSSVSMLLSFVQGPDSALPYEIEGTVWLDTRPPRDLRFEREGEAPIAMSAAP